MTFLLYGLCRECKGEYVNTIYIAGRFDKAIGNLKIKELLAQCEGKENELSVCVYINTYGEILKKKYIYII